MWNVSQQLVAGEIVNTCLNQVHGWVRLTALETPVYLNLTGNMSLDLAGRRITFERLNGSPRRAGRADPSGARNSPSSQSFDLARQQIGPTGDMTIRDGVLTLEWHGQNGHVLARCRPTDLQVSDRNERFTRSTLDLHAIPSSGLEDGLFSGIPTVAELEPHPTPRDWDDQFALLDAMLSDSGKEVPVRELLSDHLVLPVPGSLTASIAGDPCEARSTGRASIAGDPCEARSTGRASI
ncbi:MAG: hypothetical protein KDB14_12320, partial [Planctomycetales bacterium]|nr:hypothetical protein [Planctomycetales bacterium]